MGLAVVLVLRTFKFWVFLCSFVCLQELPEFVGVANVDESRAGDHSRKQFPCFFLPFATSNAPEILGVSMAGQVRAPTCDGVHLFVISATCSACCEKHVRLSQSLLLAFHPFCDRLAQGQLVIAHCVILLMCVVTKKGISLRLSLFSFIFLTCCRCRSRRDRIFTVFVGSCPVSTVSRHVQPTQKEQIQQPQSGSGALVD